MSTTAAATAAPHHHSLMPSLVAGVGIGAVSASLFAARTVPSMLSVGGIAVVSAVAAHAADTNNAAAVVTSPGAGLLAGAVAGAIVCRNVVKTDPGASMIIGAVFGGIIGAVTGATTLVANPVLEH